MPAKPDSSALTWLVSSRRWLVLLGLLAIGMAATLGGVLDAGPFSNISLIALGSAAGLGWVEVIGTLRSRRSPDQVLGAASQPWSSAILAVVLISALTAQTWFRPGTVVAGGDNTPPAGIAWISRVFLPWAWSGWNLGGPSALERKAPWAAVLGSVHLLGGSAEIAQRIWYTALFVSAAVSILALLLTVGMRPTASVVGALAYVFSPHVVSDVMPNPVYLAALALLPAVPAAILAAAVGRVRVRTAVVLVALSAPIWGYIYENPPLLAMVFVAVICTPLVAGCLFGRAAARRGALVLVLGLPLTIAVSAYWVIPSVLELASVSKDQLATLSSWSWTEGRATVINALWLNTTWGWKFPEYYPFATTYDELPLSVIKFGPAVLAFAALAVGRQSSIKRFMFGSRHFRLAVVASSVTLLLILLSTGTNPPGNIIFDHLYLLPYGWLLREPGRFLLIADMMYATLIAITIDALPRLRWQRHSLHVMTRRRFRAFTPSVVGLALVLPGFPLMTGAVVPDNRPILPSAHVQMPEYWTEMGAYVDRIPLSGAVLVLPPDDFYQMPYRWGYYGNDEFIRNLINRPVLTPSNQGYIAPTPQLLTTIDLTANSVLASNWKQVDRLLKVLGAPLVLVRGDLDLELAAFYRRDFPSPAALAIALEHSPSFDLVHTAGPLQLFALRGFSVTDSSVAPYVATVNTTTPDLRVLSLLPDNSALVSEPPRVGTPMVLEPPPLGNWRLGDKTLKWDFVQSPAWNLAFVQLDSHSSPKPIHDPITVRQLHGEGVSKDMEVSLPAENVLQNGSFQAGVWAPVGSCAGAPSGNALSATVVPNGGPSGGPYLRLTARGGSACESQLLDWHGGPLVITLDVRHGSGALPHICLWETGPERCANLPVMAEAPGWTTYSATTTPDAGTTALGLYLYADVYLPGTLTENDYAVVRVLEVPSLPQFDFVGVPVTAGTSPVLVVQDNAYSPNWSGSAGSSPVLVDGLLNGWQLSPGQLFSARYVPSDEVLAAFWVSAAGLVLALGLGLSLILRRNMVIILRVAGTGLSRLRKGRYDASDGGVR